MRIIFHTKVAEKIKTYFVLKNIFFLEISYRLRDNVEKYGTARRCTDFNTIQRMRFACWITKATHMYTHTHTNFMRLTAAVVKRTRFKIMFLPSLTF